MKVVPVWVNSKKLIVMDPKTSVWEGTEQWHIYIEILFFWCWQYGKCFPFTTHIFSSTNNIHTFQKNTLQSVPGTVYSDWNEEHFSEKKCKAYEHYGVNMTQSSHGRECHGSIHMWNVNTAVHTHTQVTRTNVARPACWKWAVSREKAKAAGKVESLLLFV